MEPQDIPLTPHEALSGISGIISLAAWFLLLLPQLYENYTNQSADGISLAFLLVWFLGDVANLLGALWGGLLPTVVALGVYFCVLDFLLIAQTLYYKTGNARRKAVEGGERGESEARDERSPLLHRQASHDSTGNLPYTRRRSSAASNPLSTVMEASLKSTARMWAKNVLAVLGVCLLGVAVWGVAWRVGWWKPQPEDDGVKEGKSIVGAEVLGYISSILYLGARIPQIWKNWREKSCEGLSLLFFMLSTLGNATYGAQVGSTETIS